MERQVEVGVSLNQAGTPIKLYLLCLPESLK